MYELILNLEKFNKVDSMKTRSNYNNDSDIFIFNKKMENYNFPLKSALRNSNCSSICSTKKKSVKFTEMMNVRENKKKKRR